MKNIKYITIVLLMLSTMVASAQESIELFTVPLSSPNKPGKLMVNQISGSISVEAYEGNEVIVKASFGNKKAHYKDDNNERDGLKRIKGTSLAISGEEKNNVVQIINEQFNRTTNLEIKVPVNFSLQLSTVNNGNIDVRGVNGELEISNVNGEITLQQISGSASADTVNGDVKVVFSSITQDASMAFSSLNGDLDITFPKSFKANLKLKSDMGEIFTDFDMVVETQKPVVDKSTSGGTYKVKVEQWVNGKINGGGPEMLFKNFNGDIIIRSN